MNENCEKSIFSEYCEKITVWHNPEDEILKGDYVSTTTSEFSWNGLEDCFDGTATDFTEVIAVQYDEDMSNYIPEKSRNGGAYGYRYYIVVEVLE